MGESISDSLRAGRSGDRIPLGSRISATVRSDPTNLPYHVLLVIPGGKVVSLTTHSYLTFWLKKEYNHISTPPLWLFGEVTGRNLPLLPRTRDIFPSNTPLHPSQSPNFRFQPCYTISVFQSAAGCVHVSSSGLIAFSVQWQQSLVPHFS